MGWDAARGGLGLSWGAEVVGVEYEKMRDDSGKVGKGGTGGRERDESDEIQYLFSSKISPIQKITTYDKKYCIC